MIKERREFEELDSVINKRFIQHPHAQIIKNFELPLKPWLQPIPVVVFACNRPNALREHLKKLIRFFLIFFLIYFCFLDLEEILNNFPLLSVRIVITERLNWWFQNLKNKFSTLRFVFEFKFILIKYSGCDMCGLIGSVFD